MTNTVLKKFLDETDGAVTVDWVVLTAVIVGLGIGVILAISAGMNNTVGSVSFELNQADTFRERVSDAVNGD